MRNASDDRKQLSAWSQLGKVYSKEGIVPVLGAGLSGGSLLPAWPELLRRVAKRCGPGASPSLVKKLLGKGFSMPAIAGMLRTMCTSREQFTELVRDALYEKFRDKL